MADLNKKLLDFLVQGKFIEQKKLDQLLIQAKNSKKPIEEILLEENILKDSELGQITADLNGWKFINLKKEEIDPKIFRLIPKAVAENQKVFALEKTDKGIKVAMTNPNDTQLIHLLKKRMGAEILAFYATEADIHTQLFNYEEDLEGEFEKLIKAYAQDVNIEDSNDSAIVKIVDLLLNQGYEKKASDIHIEPQEESLTVRFRIDGVMHDITDIPKTLHDSIVTRIKVMSRLRTDEHQVPQDGKIRYVFDKSPVDIRVSIVPTTKGENAVLRLLSENARQLTLEDLGLAEDGYNKISNSIKKPWGMMLVTGPTGSGKTTTLYSILKILNKSEVNIATIEDPVEYNINGISQIQVNPKADLTFASGLRSIVRQDPNIIMVGEIRDEETAGIAVNSAMTGHLVLSTLHTNDAATTLPRLLDMGIEPFLISSTVNVVIAQRLVRRICSNCIQSSQTKISEIKGRIPDDLLKKIAKGKTAITTYHGKGCQVCKNTGYLGRIGVFEILEIDKDVRALITNNADADKIKELAIKKGMTTMFDDAVGKMVNGVTTLEEILRVVKS